MKRSTCFVRLGFRRKFSIGLLAICGWCWGVGIGRGAGTPDAAPTPPPERMTFKQIIRRTPVPTPIPASWKPVLKSAAPAATPAPAPEAVAAPARMTPLAKKTPLPAVADEHQQNDARRALQAKLDAEKKAETDRKLAAAKKKADEEQRLAAARKKAGEEQAQAAAKKKADEEKLLATTRKKTDEAPKLAEAGKKADTGKKVAAAKPAEEDKQVAVAKPAEQEKPAAEVKKAEPESRVETKGLLTASPSVQTRAKLEQAVARTKEQAPALALNMRLGEVDMALGDPAAAQLAYQVALGKANSPESSRQASQKLAEAAAASGDFKLASSQWATLRMQTGPATEPRLLAAEAMALAAQRHYPDSEKLWAEVQGAGKASSAGVQAQAALGQALAAELQGKAGEARQLFRRVLKDFAGTPQAAAAQARLDDLKTPIIP